VIRISRALNYAGAPVPTKRKGLLVVPGADGYHYALRVREFRRYLIDTYGSPDLLAKGGSPPEDWRRHKGIIVFDVRGWSNATGHVDLWNGVGCEYACYWGKASEVMLWAEPPRAKPPHDQPFSFDMCRL